MINALRYEPRGQRQRFEPREQQSGEVGQRHIHLHLNLHVHLTLGARRARRLWQLTAARVTTIFAAFIGALSMALSFTVMSTSSFHFIGPHIDLANNFMLIGALLGSGAVLLGGLPLVVETWRSAPRSRLLLIIPLLAILMLLILAGPLASPLLGVIRQLLIPLGPRLGAQLSGNAIVAFLLYVFPLVNTIAIVRAIRRANLSDKVLRFTTIPSLLIVLGMFLMIGGMLLWAGTVLFFLPSVFPQILALLMLPYNSWLLQFIGMLIALVVMLRALFSHSHARTEARPKDASPSDVDSEHLPRGYQG
jgi:MFS family permease